MDIRNTRDSKIHTIAWIILSIVVLIGSQKIIYLHAFAHNRNADESLGTKQRQETSDRPELVLQTGHAEKVEGIAYSPDGLLIASCSADSTIKLWDVVQGRELRTLTGHEGSVKAVAFSPNGERLVSGGNDGKVRLWDVATGHEINTLPGHTSRINTVIFSPDARLIASGGADQMIRIWEAGTGREVRTLPGHKGWVLALAFSPDNQTLASGGADNTIKLWQVNSDEKPSTITDHSGWVQALAFNPNGSVLASGGVDGAVKFRKIAKGVKLPSLPRSTAALLSLAFSRDGNTLTTASADRKVKQFDLTTGREKQLFSPSDTVETYEAVVFSPDLLWQASSIGSRKVELRRLAPGGEVRRLESNANGVLATAFSPDRRWFASGHDDNTVKIWDLVAGRQVRTLQGNLGKVTAIAISSSGEWLASGSLGNTVKLWNIVTGREVLTSLNHAGSVNAVIFSPDGKCLITGSDDKTIRVWDIATGRELRALKEHTNDVNALAQSADGRWLISGSADKTVKVWDLTTGKVIWNLTGHTGTIFALALNPDGRLLASGGADKTIKLWDLSAGRELRSITSHKNYIYALAFSPDGSLLASAGADRGVKLLDVASAQERFQMLGHSGQVNSLSFTANGRMLASSSEDGSTRLWSSETGAHLATLISLRERTDWLVVTPDGSFDGSPGAWGQILWRFAQNTFKSVPVEVFFNEFFYPDLLADVITETKVQVTTDITQLDRRQPEVKIISTDAPNDQTGSRFVSVKITVSEVPSDGEHSRGSGANDVRLFRNGSLVKIWHGDVLKGKTSATLEHKIPIVVGENRLTAYAFNLDNIKSADDTRTVVRNSAVPRRSGTLHLIAIGVSQYEIAQYNLEYAADDARIFTDEIRDQQGRLRQFEKVEVLTLLDKDATKANILTLLHNLSGTSQRTGQVSSDKPQGISAVQPEDAVIVFFAGHGWADRGTSERYHLFPYDIGNKDDRDSILERSITDLDLEEAFEELDASNLLLIIDSCDSGQALEAKEKRRGPMNSKGLAQLAYEKGMNILTASQNDQSAYETKALGHGYLTWALIGEGLRKMSADDNPQDGEVVLREWLDFATSYVPRLHDEISGAARLHDEKLKAARLLTQRKTVPEVNEAQRPRVFYRREPEVSPFVIARKDARGIAR